MHIPSEQKTNIIQALHNFQLNFNVTTGNNL